MKKIYIILASLTMFVTVATAQDEEEKSDSEKFKFGAKVGLNNANVYDAQGEEFNADAKIGFAGGVFMAIPIGKYIGVQPEIMFSQKGFSATGRLLGSTYDFTKTTNYLDIPLFVAIKPVDFLTVLVGPQFSYLISTKNVFSSTSSSYSQEQVFKNDEIRKNTLCFVGGVDINIKHVVLGLRAGWDVRNNRGDGTSTTPRYKNAWLQATVGYALF